MSKFSLITKSLILLCVVGLFLGLTAAKLSGGPTIIIDDTTYSCPNNGIFAYPNPSHVGLQLHFEADPYVLSISAVNSDNDEVYALTQTVSTNDVITVPSNEWTEGYHYFTLTGNNCSSTISIMVK